MDLPYHEIIYNILPFLLWGKKEEKKKERKKGIIQTSNCTGMSSLRLFFIFLKRILGRCAKEGFVGLVRWGNSLLIYMPPLPPSMSLSLLIYLFLSPSQPLSLSLSYILYIYYILHTNTHMYVHISLSHSLSHSHISSLTLSFFLSFSKPLFFHNQLITAFGRYSKPLTPPLDMGSISPSFCNELFSPSLRQIRRVVR